jgi:1-acyl-sn-glycerol-3-phosphate acyltransferase
MRSIKTTPMPMHDAPLRDDPVALRSPTLVRLFSRYARRFIKKNFHALRLAGSGQSRLPTDCPVIVYCNHPSWWDPLILLALTDSLCHGRPGYGPIDNAMLDKYRFMRRIGVFGIEPGATRGARRFLRVGARVLQQPGAVLMVTAQGAFTDPRARPVQLKPGVEALLQRVPHAVCVPLAIEYPFWNERYPEALCRIGTPLESKARNIQQMLVEELTHTMNLLAADAICRDPARFATIVGGSVGIGGIYDQGRRLKTLLNGKRFNPAHGEPESMEESK